MLAVPQGLSMSLGPGMGSELLYKEGGKENTVRKVFIEHLLYALYIELLSPA